MLALDMGKKRILIGTFGTRGDVQPMVALTRVLRARGHEVDLCIPPNFCDWAAGLGVQAHAVGENAEEFIAAHGEKLWSGIPTVRRAMAEQVRFMLPFAEKADVFLAASLCPASAIFEEKFGRPGRYILFSPSLVASDAHPSPLTRWQRMPRLINRMSWAIENVVWNACFLGPLNELRRSMGLGPARDLLASVIGPRCIVASEPLVSEAPRPPGVAAEQTGAWFFDDPAPVPEELERFLAAGPPPVFIGFGSMTDSRPERTMARLLEAIRIAKVRAIVARGWAGLAGGPLPEGVLAVGPTPHARVFPRCAAVVHHGGAGTSHQVLRAGVPQIVMPHLMDQFYWADRIERLGVTPGKQPRADIDPRRLAEGLRRCVEEEPLRARARDVAARMRLDGLERTVALVEGL